MMQRDHLAAEPDTGILFTDWLDQTGEHALLGQPGMLLPLMDKCLLQRAIEQLVRLGCRHIHVLLGEEAAAIRAFAQTGERWGCIIHYHYRQPRESLGDLARRLDLADTGRYWVADATRIPAEPVQRPGHSGEHVVSLLAPGQPYRQWSGWALLSGGWLRAQSFEPHHRLLGELLLDKVFFQQELVASPLLEASTPADLLRAARSLLAAPGRAAIQVGRGSRIDASARLVPPVHVGADVRIGPGTIVGPGVIIEQGAIIDAGSRLQQSVVLADTYVGKELELDGVIVNGHRLADISLGSITLVTDPWLLAAMPGPGMHVSARQRWLTQMLRIGLMPLYALARTLTGVPRKTMSVTIPCPRGDRVDHRQIGVTLVLPQIVSDAPRPWATHFCRTFYPGLREVQRGVLSLVGPSLRPAAEVHRLTPEWRRLYAESRCGLLSEALLQGTSGLEQDIAFASDALACAGQNDSSVTMALLRHYLALVVRDIVVHHRPV